MFLSVTTFGFRRVSALKGAAIGSGSVVGFGALATKAYPSNPDYQEVPQSLGIKKLLGIVRVVIAIRQSKQKTRLIL